MDDPASHATFLAVRSSYASLLTQAVAFVLPLNAPAQPSEDWVKSHLLAGERGAAELQPLEECLPPVQIGGGKLHLAGGRTVPIKLEEHFYSDGVALAMLLIDGFSLWDASPTTSLANTTASGSSTSAPSIISPRSHSSSASSDAELLLTEEEARQALGPSTVRSVLTVLPELQRTPPSATTLAKCTATLMTRLKIKAQHQAHVSVLLLAALYPTWFPLVCTTHSSADQRVSELLQVAHGVQLADLAWDEPETESKWEAAIEEAAGRLQSSESARTPHDRLAAVHLAVTSLTSHSSRLKLNLNPERLLLLCTVAFARAQLPHWHSTVAYISTLHPYAACLSASGPGYHLATFQAAAEHLRQEDGFRTLVAARRTRAVRSSLLPSQPNSARRNTATSNTIGSLPVPVSVSMSVPVPLVYKEPPRVISLDDEDADYGDFLSNLRSNG